MVHSDLSLVSCERVNPGPAGTPGNQQCAPIEDTEFTPWPASTMADDIAFGETLSSAYSATGKRKVKRAAPSSYDMRKNAKFSTTIKDQNSISCGLCAPFSFTTAVEVGFVVAPLESLITFKVDRARINGSKRDTVIRKICPLSGLVGVKEASHATQANKGVTSRRS